MITTERFWVTVEKDVAIQCVRVAFKAAAAAAASAPATTSSSTEPTTATASSSSSSSLPPRPKNVIVCVHPLGKMGGSAGNVAGIAQHTARLGRGLWDVVFFDQRGVGKSTGSSSWTCSDEVADVKKLCEELATNPKVGGPFEKIFLVGSSAGACVAGSALDSHPKIEGGVFIGYPFGWMASVLFSGHHKNILKSTKPKLLVQATEDGFTSMSQFEDLMKALKGDRNEKIIIKDVGHFEMEGPAYDVLVSKSICEFFSSLLY